MSDTNAQEPTMEEILASIRRIISEDDAPAAKVEDTPAAPVRAHDDAGDDEDVLELTQPLDHAPPSHSADPEGADAGQALGDLDVFTPDAPAPLAFQPPPAREEPLVSAPAATAAASYFGALSKTIAMPADGRTLEDVVTAMLRPMLKDWLDAHLPGIVEAKVRDEVERISRGR